MGRPVTLFTGQWADLKLEDLCKKAKDFGYDGLELACWGDQFEVDKALSDDTYCARKRELLEKYDLQVFAISNHLIGQAVLDNIDERHKSILPPYIWGDGKPEGVTRRAIEEMKNTARAAQKLGVGIVNGFTGSSVTTPDLRFSANTKSPGTMPAFKLLADRWNPILDVFQECGIKFALEVHPTEIAFDIYSAERAVAALGGREEFGFNFDPSHLIWQGVDPAEFIRYFPNRIYHVHMKDAKVMLNGRSGILASHLSFGDHRRGWDFRSMGRGGVNFEEVIRALNAAKYTGPLSVEWEDSGMDREHGARESCQYVKNIDFAPSGRAFDSAFSE